MPEEIETYRSSVNLNIRAAPTTASAILGRLAQGTVIEKLAESEDGRWLRFNLNGVEGWSYKHYLSKIARVTRPDGDFPWMAIAEAEKGVFEFPGTGNNPRVLEYFSAVTNLSASAVSRDETPWCSAFANWCLAQAGLEGTKSALARSWLDWGQPVDTPVRGCLVVFEREVVFGHVGFYLDETENEIKVLGGNQQNPETKIFEVSEKYYPKANLLGYRIPE